VCLGCGGTVAEVRVWGRTPWVRVGCWRTEPDEGRSPITDSLMRAAVLERRGEPLAVRDVAVPEIGVGEVLVAVKASGVCYTDLRLIDGPDRAEPIIPGHEPVGVIAAVGAEVRVWGRTPWVRVGCWRTEPDEGDGRSLIR